MSRATPPPPRTTTPRAAQKLDPSLQRGAGGFNEEGRGGNSFGGEDVQAPLLDPRPPSKGLP